MDEPLLTAALDEISKALDDEIRAIRTGSGSSFTLTSGRCLHRSDGGALYTFSADLRLPIAPETPVTFSAPDCEPTPGVLVEVDDFRVLLQLVHDMGDTIDRAKITTQPDFLLVALAEKLADIGTALREPSPPTGAAPRSTEIPLAALGLRKPDRTSPASAAALAPLRGAQPPLNELQMEAIRGCTESSLHFVWGPPGTGKTACLAHAVRGLVEQGESVLVLAHANAAIDVAMLRLVSAFSGTDAIGGGKIIRIGVPQVPEIFDHPEILPDGVLERTHPDLISMRRTLRTRRQRISERLRTSETDDARKQLADELRSIRDQLAKIEEAIRAALAELIADADVIGTTLSRFAIDGSIWARNADAIVIDEVSMASFPYVLAAAFRARKRLLLFGDFRQLPPIHLAKSRGAKKWLGRDAFQVAGLAAEVANLAADDRMTLLRTQYRMSPEIAGTVSRLAYAGKLVTPDPVAHEVRPIARFAPLPGAPLIVMDTSGLRGSCYQDPKAGSYSRFNPVHAAIAVSAAQVAADSGAASISIITPYRTQAQLIAQVAAPLRESGVLRVATVHRFQGGESDVVIVDLVDAPTMRGASRLTGSDPETSLRLLNVALSRAKGKLLVVADGRFVAERHPARSPAHAALLAMEQLGERCAMTPESVIDVLPATTIEWSSGWDDARSRLEAALDRATNRLVLNLPPAFTPSDDLVESLERSLERGVSAAVFAPARVAEALEHTNAELRLLNLPGGFFALVDGATAFVGGQSPDGLIAALDGADQTEALERLLVGDALTAPPPDSDTEQRVAALCGRCPECGEDRRPRRAPGNGLFLRCGATSHPAEPLSPEGIQSIVSAMGAACPACGRVAVVRNGPRGPFLGCPGYSAGCEGRPPAFETLFGEA